MTISSPPPLDEHSRATEDEGEGRTKRLFDEVAGWGVLFKTHRPDHPEAQSIVPRQVSSDSTPESGLTDEQLIHEFRSIIAKSTKSRSPDFLGFPDITTCPAAVGAALLIPLLNQNMANSETCPPKATFVEMEAIQWLLLPSKIRVLVPDMAENHSMRSAMAMISLGEENIIPVLVDAEFHMDQEALQRIIDQQGKLGDAVMACVAYAVDPTCLRIDDLHGLSQILQEEDIWFHVDACHGSQLAFSERHRYKLREIEKADSITVDPQQALLIPYDCSLVLFRESDTQASLSTDSDSISNTQWSFGGTSPFTGSRAFNSLKIWSSIKSHGKNSMGRMIDGRLELTNAIQLDVEH
ncbi:glutamic acid decarboxylase [Fusarium acutatum]|uniref:Glutamic acid decarboxylase n=1 Tax=Fusarium acutatum TaxID=78861 RepID=A0A8H4K2I6_9HYPO|nr:glutamic acid decarboxylase [Fusarium acutatum]